MILNCPCCPKCGSTWIDTDLLQPDLWRCGPCGWRGPDQKLIVPLNENGDHRPGDRRSF